MFLDLRNDFSIKVFGYAEPANLKSDFQNSKWNWSENYVVEILNLIPLLL